MGQNYIGIKLFLMLWFDIPGLLDMLFFGFIFFVYDLFLYFGILFIVVVWVFLKYICVGLILCVVGENYDVVYVFGYYVICVCIFVIMFGGVCVGFGGVYISFICVL